MIFFFINETSDSRHRTRSQKSEFLLFSKCMTKNLNVLCLLLLNSLLEIHTEVQFRSVEVFKLHNFQKVSDTRLARAPLESGID